VTVATVIAADGVEVSVRLVAPGAGVTVMEADLATVPLRVRLALVSARTGKAAEQSIAAMTRSLTTNPFDMMCLLAMLRSMLYRFILGRLPESAVLKPESIWPRWK
jgi:hypothetical protein